MILRNKLTHCILKCCAYKLRLLSGFLCISFILLCSHFGEVLNNFDTHNNKYCDEPIDIVYTWVNGSDPIFLNDLNEYLSKSEPSQKDSSQQRYDDKYELKFSLRSLEKYAPWVNHVFIVTNGQIPYWLNLDYEKVSVISHEEIFQDLNNLPTFSSPAIEFNIHRIPGLSKKFIYFNDDTFLGAPIYPEDFYSPNRGFLVYLSWPLPSCMPSCPWIYVGDGQCDASCFYENCQFDGQDCNFKKQANNKKKHSFGVHHDDDHDEFKHAIEYEYFEEDKKEIEASLKELKEKSVIQNGGSTNLSNVKLPVQENKFETLLNHSKTHYSKLVHDYNRKTLESNKLRRRKSLYKTVQQRKTSNNNQYAKNVTRPRSDKNLDTYGLSLQTTQKLFNLIYGFKSRKVPAHAPILIDKEIMFNLQNKFKTLIAETEKNRVRSPTDLQFSFMYYYFLMNEKSRNDISDIFDQFDTDDSQTWSDREIRTILTQLNELPLNYEMVEKFDSAIINCSKNIKIPDITSPPFERYLDSKLPLVTKKLILNCPKIMNMLSDKFGMKVMYHYEVIKNAATSVLTFKMLTSNVSDVVGQLDEIRSSPRKFVCLNDNMSWIKSEENILVKAILLDFYISLFPKPSKFELSQEYRNRFSHIKDLNTWKDYHSMIKIFYVICIVLLASIFLYNFCKRRLIRRIKSIIYL